MKYEVVLTDEAKQNVRDAIAWYESQSEAAANRWYDGLVGAIDSLSTDPQRCTLARENSRAPIELRELHYGSGRRPTHRMIFAIRPQSVVVYAVRHVAQEDWHPDSLASD